MDSAALGAILEADKKDFPKYLKDLHRSTASRIEGWSDAELIKLREGVKYGSSGFNRASRLQVYCRFYDFYFHGIVDSLDNVVAIVADACSIARTQKGAI